MKKMFILVAATFFTLSLSGLALAFHGGGVAHCDGCHSMHAGSGNDNFVASGPSLTNGSDASSTCLNCHDGAGRYHISSADGSNTNEGGDFHWIKDNGYQYVVRGDVYFDDWRNHGHSVVAADFGMLEDVNTTVAPGGTYDAADLGCTSCHDPHGEAGGGTAGGADPISVSGSYGGVPVAGTQAGNYRLLYDFSALVPAPIARANNYDGASVQYGTGMSEWCGACHGDFLDGTTADMHPVDIGVPATYNSYLATGEYVAAGAPLPYDPLVPIERDNTVTASSDLPDPTDEATAGVPAGGNAQVMCLTCHRAHASPFENALRWDYTSSEFIAETWTTLNSNVPATAAEYYKHGAEIDVAVNDPALGPFTDGYGEFQRSLCNKCHVQD